MRTLRARQWRAIGVFAILAAVVAPVLWTEPAVAASSPWSTPRVRFEPIDKANAATNVEGVGDYRGSIELVANGGGVAVVNEVTFDEYIRGISEVPNSWHPEALKTQAIAARTYVLNQMQNGAPPSAAAVGAQICATDACQVYTGLAKERSAGGENWVAAVTATSNQVLLYQGRALLAKYSSSNGGRTVDGGKPYLVSVPDPDDARSPLSKWRFDVPLSSLAGRFGVAGEVTSARTAGDVVVLAYRRPDASTGEHRVGILAFRERINADFPVGAMRPKAVPSTRFTVKTSGGTAIIEGGGWGHGIGMSQYGALGKAERGMKAADILAAYYKGITPTAVGADQIPPSVKVVVATGRSQATVTVNTPFRVTDAAGNPLAVIAEGTWNVRSSGGSLSITPPAGYDKAPELTIAEVAPYAPEIGEVTQVDVTVSAASLVTISVRDELGGTVTTQPVVLSAGEHRLPAPAVAVSGEAVVQVSADAGGGRIATAAKEVRVAEPRRLVVPAKSLFDATSSSKPLELATANRSSSPSNWPLAVAALMVGIAIASAVLTRRLRG